MKVKVTKTVKEEQPADDMDARLARVLKWIVEGERQRDALAVTKGKAAEKMTDSLTTHLGKLRKRCEKLQKRLAQG